MMMIFCTVLVLPIIFNFSQFSALEGQFGYFVNKFSLGNLGGAHTQCVQVPYMSQQAHFALNCQSGIIDLDSLDHRTGSKLFQIGIINTS